MKPRKNDLSIVGRLNEGPSRAHSVNYGVDRLGISRMTQQDTQAANQAELEAAMSAAALAQSQQAAPGAIATQTHAGDSNGPAMVATLISAPAGAGRVKKYFWLALAGLAMMTLLASYTMHTVRKSASMPSQAAAAPVPQVVITPAPQPAVPAVKTPSPTVVVAPPERHVVVEPAKSPAVAEGGNVLIARAPVVEISREPRDGVSEVSPAVAPTAVLPVEPAPAPVVAPAAPPAAKPASAPAQIRFRDCPPGFALSGVIQFPDGAYASLNGKMVKVGGVVNGAKVVSIGSYSIEMEMGGQRFIVGIGQSNVRSAGDEPTGDEAASKPAKSKNKRKAASKPAPKPTSEEEEPAEE